MKDAISRNITADLMKGLAVVFMIQVHITELFMSPEIMDTTYGKVSMFFGGPPAAPVFMAVMGFFLYLSSKDLNTTLKRAGLIFGGGLLLNIGLNFNLIISVLWGRFDFNIWHFILGADILTLAGLSIAVIALLKHYFPESVIAPLFMLGLTLAINSPLKSFSMDESDPVNFIGAFLWGGVWWSYFPLFPWLAYPLTGYIFSLAKNRYNISINRNLFFTVVFLSFLLMIFTMDFATEITSALQQYYNHGILFYGWILNFLFLYTVSVNGISEIIKANIITNYLVWLGKNVTAVYVVQWLLIGNIATEIYQTLDIYDGLVWFVLILAASSAVVYFKNKFIKNF